MRKLIFALLGCAALTAYASTPPTFTADSGGPAPFHVKRAKEREKLERRMLRFGSTFGATLSAPMNEVNCVSATSTPCTTAGNPGNGSQGDPAWLAFGKLNAWGTQLGLFANQTGNEVLATPDGTTGIPALRALVGNDIPPINLAITTNGGITGILGVANGGTGLSTVVANDCLAGNSGGTALQYVTCGTGGSGVTSISGDGSLFTNSTSTGAVTLALGSAPGYGVWGNDTSASGTPAYTALSSWPAAAFPTLNQNTTGTAANITATTNATLTTLSALSLPVGQLTGVLPVANGGTGTATPSLVAGTNVTITGTWPDQTITASSTASTAFSALTTGTNTTATMTVGSGASILASGTGSITATAAPLSGLTGLGTGVSTALAVNTGSAGAFVVNGGALGTPSSGVATNLTGTAGGLTAGTATAANGLNSATTTVSVNSAAAPTTGQVLTATSGTTATWQTPSTGTVTTSGTPTAGSIAAFSGSTSITAATAPQVLSLVNSQTCNAQTGTTYTFVLSDANNCVTMSNTAANTVTVPTNASVAFPVGTTLTVVQDGAGATTVEGAGSPVTLQSAKYGSSTTQTYVFPAEYSCLSLQQTATNTWFVSSCDYNPGGGSGTVTDGSGTTTANELAVSTTTAHTIGYAATLPTGAMPALTGDLTGTAGSLSVTVSKVNNAAIPASATALASNASSQIVAASTVTYLIDSGTAFTLGTGTGACATDSVVHAGAANGEVTCTGTTGASTLVVNLPTTTNMWACTATDITQKAMIPESASTTTSVTFSGSVTANDDIVVQCTGF